MSYDEQLARRVRLRLPADPEERRMFGGIGFMISGRLCVAVMGDGLLVRVGQEAASDLSRLPQVRFMTMGKRTMSGWVYVEPAGLASDDDLSTWMQRGLEYAAGLPPNH